MASYFVVFARSRTDFHNHKLQRPECVVCLDTLWNKMRSQILIYHTTWCCCCFCWSSSSSLPGSTTEQSTHTWFLIKLPFMRPTTLMALFGSAKNVPKLCVRLTPKVAALSPSLTSQQHLVPLNGEEDVGPWKLHICSHKRGASAGWGCYGDGGPFQETTTTRRSTGTPHKRR